MDPRKRSEVKRDLRRGGWLFFWIYFAQKFGNNMEGLTKLSMRKVLKSDLKLDAGQQGAVQSFTGLGWFVKAFYGIISDRIPILGYRRKSWLVIANILAGLAWCMLVVTDAPTYTRIILTVTVVNICIAFADVICDGLMVETAQRLEREHSIAEGTANRPLQAMQWIGAYIAIFLCSVVGGVIAQFYTLSTAATFSSAVLIVLGLGVGFFIPEKRVAYDPQKAKRGWVACGVIVALVAYRYLSAEYMPPGHWFGAYKPYFDTVMVFSIMVVLAEIPRSFVLPLGFSMLWWGMPLYLDSSTPYQYFTGDHGEFLTALKTDTTIVPALKQLAVTLGVTSPEAIEKAGFHEAFYGSIVMSCFALGGIVGLLFFRSWFNDWEHGAIFRACIVARVVVLALFFIGSQQPEVVGPRMLMLMFTIGGFADSWAVLAVLSFAVSKCPPENQASVYATFASCANIGVLLGGETFGGHIYSWAGLAYTSADLDEAGKVVDAAKAAAHAHDGIFAVVLISAFFLVAMWLGTRLLDAHGHFDTDN